MDFKRKLPCTVCYRNLVQQCIFRGITSARTCIANTRYCKKNFSCLSYLFVCWHSKALPKQENPFKWAIRVVFDTITNDR